MMTQEMNDRLTRVGKGTPTGELLRRYWHPVAAVTQFDDKAIHPLRLMGEDLVIYKDLSGNYGMIQRHCPHRRADLAFGYVEETGIRCNYHGWQFDQKGACVHQPFEDATLPENKGRSAIQATAYKAQAHAGMVWAYLGPEPAPLIPNFEPFTWENCFIQIVLAEVPCNWLQCQENGMDPVHFEWLHANWSQALKGKRVYSPTHTKIGFDEWEFGYRYKRILADTNEEDFRWREGRVTILPNVFVPEHFEWRIPIDDYNTLSLIWHWTRVPNDMIPYKQEHIPHWWAPITDDKGNLLHTRVVNQDSLACAGQGRISDRTQEHLATSDRGIMMMRRQLDRDIDAVARGEDPKGLVRDPIQNECIAWPMDLQSGIARGGSREEWHERNARFRSEEGDYFFILEGQPPEVREQFNAAMGLDRIVEIDSVS